MKDWTTHFELDAYGFRVEVFVPLETVEEKRYREHRAAKRKARKAAWASIDWRNVEALNDDEKCVYENPAYLSVPF